MNSKPVLFSSVPSARTLPAISILLNIICILSLQATAFCTIANASTLDENQTFYFECQDDYSFVARIGDRSAWLFLPDQTLELPRRKTMSGVAYTNGNAAFSLDDDSAWLRTGTVSHRGCRNNQARAVWDDAKLNGVDFRAVGNEPGWYLEIRFGEDMLFVDDYGKSRYRFRTPEPQSDPQSRTAVLSAKTPRHDFVVTLRGEACSDTMSGESFETTVTVELDGRTFHGCGRALH